MPILYSRRVVYIDKRWQSTLPQVKKCFVYSSPDKFILPRTLLHTKDLEFHLIEDSKVDDDPVNYEELPVFVAEVLKMTPNLQSFRCVKYSHHFKLCLLYLSLKLLGHYLFRILDFNIYNAEAYLSAL